jgi:2-oxoglutarate ferredoxin oxidoreductase subunit delta
VHFCPKGVFKTANDLNRFGYYYVYPAEVEKCIFCGICEKYCPDFAIKVIREEEKKKEG